MRSNAGFNRNAVWPLTSVSVMGFCESLVLFSGLLYMSALELHFSSTGSRSYYEDQFIFRDILLEVLVRRAQGTMSA